MGIIELLISALKFLLPNLFNQWKLEKKYFEIIWKPSSKLTPEVILNLRGFDKNGFNKYYYKRDVDELLKVKVNNDENVLIIGNPLSGKSRAVYELLNNFNEKAHVLIPTREDIKLDEFKIPKKIGLGRKLAIYNDIDKHASKRNFSYQLEQLLQNNIQIIATCQTGNELEILKSNLDKDFTTIFNDPIEIKEITLDVASLISKEINMELPDRFDGNLGSIFIPLDTMRRRYAHLSDKDKQILININFLYVAGIFYENGVFSKDNIKLLCKYDSELELANHEWENAFNRLAKLSLLQNKKNSVICDDVYFHKVIQSDLDIKECLKTAINIFSEDFDSLHQISNSTYQLGLIREKRQFMKLSIDALTAAISITNKTEFPMDYAMTQNGLGAAYGTLAEVEDKSSNCKNAIDAYEEALKVYEADIFPDINQRIKTSLDSTIEFCRNNV